jgi:group I intron endonuclease
MKPKITGIYKITSPTGRVYIGQSHDIIDRFRCYKRLKCKKQTRLYASFIKHGVENHSFEILIECQTAELDYIETKFILEYNSTNKKCGLNLKEGGAYGKHNEETKEKIGKANKGKIVSKEARANMSKAQKNISALKSENATKWQTGRKLSETHKENIRKALIGNQYSKGNKWNDEQRKKIPELHKGNKYNLGRKRSDAEKQRLSLLHKGKPKSREQKVKMSISGKRRFFIERQNPNQLILL